MTVRIDPLASVVGRYEARDGGRQTLMLGSHIDTVRNAGRFDGPLGVITAIEVVKAAFKSGKRFPFAIEVDRVRRRRGRALCEHARRRAQRSPARSMAKPSTRSVKTACRAARP